MNKIDKNTREEISKRVKVIRIANYISLGLIAFVNGLIPWAASHENKDVVKVAAVIQFVVLLIAIAVIGKSMSASGKIKEEIEEETEE